MQIVIAQRLRPFSHRPGTVCLVPFTFWQVQVFPTLLKFYHLMTGEKKEQRLNWKGPVLDFTVELDLEKGVVWVYGHTEDGYRRHVIELPRENIPQPMERLSLGMHKALDWELVCRRRDLREIFPLWVRLGQMVPAAEGSFQLFRSFDKLEVVKAYTKFFMTRFEGLLMPRLEDSDHQGITAEGKVTGSPLALLIDGARHIRSLFFDDWSFLPCLPPEFHAGRFVHFRTREGDTIDFEWSKKLLRRVVIHSGISRKISPSFQKSLHSYRLRSSLKEKGIRKKVEEPLDLQTGQTLYLDRFEK